MRTITISQKEGIKAVIGKPKGKKGTEVQSYLFPKTKGWTLEKAKTWFEEHKSESLPGHSLLLSLQFLTEKADPETRIFPWSMPAKYYAKPGRLLIYGTALLAGETRKGDKFSCQELTRAARGLVGGPIEVFEHTWDVGESRWLPFPDNIILDGEEVDGRLEYIAGVSEPKVQELIRDATIAKVSVNTICRHVPAEDPGQCDGMILNGFCLLHKDSVPASPGTSVNVWNCLKVNPDRLKSASMPCLSESEGKNMSEKNEKQPPGAETKTEQVTGHGPVAGIPEPSVEDRVKTLEQRFESFDQRTSQEFTAINAKLDTLIQTKGSAPALVVAAPTTAAVPGPNVKKEDLSQAELEAKIKELSLQRDELYKQQDELGKAVDKASEAERETQKEKRRQINEQLDILWAELEAYRQAFTKFIVAQITEIKPEKVGEKPNVKTEKAPSTGQGITKPIGDLPPSQPGMVPVTELKKVFDDQRLFTPQLREKAILRLIGQEGDVHD
jgi:hypothetical protein